MLTYIARRILYSIPVLVVSSFLSFVFVAEAGDPLSNLRANPRTTAGTLHQLAHQYHLDQTVVLRYWYWVKDLFNLHHPLGISLITTQPMARHPPGDGAHAP